MPTIRVFCGVGGRAKSVARDDEAGVERAQRRVTQEAAEEDKGRREKRTSCWEFFSGTRRISRGEREESLAEIFVVDYGWASTSIALAALHPL